MKHTDYTKFVLKINKKDSTLQLRKMQQKSYIKLKLIISVNYTLIPNDHCIFSRTHRHILHQALLNNINGHGKISNIFWHRAIDKSQKWH